MTTACMTRLALQPMPAFVEAMNNPVRTAYAAHPDRICLVGTNGQIAFQGGPGPSGFDPDELAIAIRKKLDLD